MVTYRCVISIEISGAHSQHLLLACVSVDQLGFIWFGLDVAPSFGCIQASSSAFWPCWIRGYPRQIVLRDKDCRNLTGQTQSFMHISGYSLLISSWPKEVIDQGSQRGKYIPFLQAVTRVWTCNTTTGFEELRLIIWSSIRVFYYQVRIFFIWLYWFLFYVPNIF